MTGSATSSSAAAGVPRSPPTSGSPCSVTCRSSTQSARVATRVDPVIAVDPDSETAQAFRAIAEKLAALGPARVYRRELSLR